MSVTVSIIIPAYNAFSYLGDCIESVISGTFQDFEVLLIDDGSTDGTAELCDEFALKDPRIFVIHQENHGISAARNVGLDHANGKYVSFIDADDFIDPKMLSSLVSLIESGAELAVCNPFICAREEANFQKQTEEPSVRYFHGVDECLSVIVWGVWVWNKLFRRDVIEINNIRFQTECSVSEDQWFNTDYISRISCVALTDQKLYYHIQTPGSCMSRFRTNRTVSDKYIWVPRGWEYTAQHVNNKQSFAYFQSVARAAMFYQTVLKKLEKPDSQYIEEAVVYVKQNKSALLRYGWGVKYYLSAIVLSISYPLWAKIFRRGLAA